MVQTNIEQMHFDATIPVCGLYSARTVARLFNIGIVAVLGYRNICLNINKDTDLINAKKEYEEKLRFLVDIESKKQEYRKSR